MIVELLEGARRLDAWIAGKFGRTYHAVLGLGLVIEIVRRIREIGALPDAGMSTVRLIFAIALFGFLLLHQIGELAEHRARRRNDGAW